MTTARVVSPIQSIIPSAPACVRAPKTGNGAVRTAPARRAGFQPAGYPGILPGVGMVLFRGRTATGGWEAASTGRQDACPTPPGETADLLALLRPPPENQSHPEEGGEECGPSNPFQSRRNDNEKRQGATRRRK